MCTEELLCVHNGESRSCDVGRRDASFLLPILSSTLLSTELPHRLPVDEQYNSLRTRVSLAVRLHHRRIPRGGSRPLHGIDTFVNLHPSGRLTGK